MLEDEIEHNNKYDKIVIRNLKKI